MRADRVTTTTRSVRSVVVCGSSFGQVYLEAVGSDPDWKLVGILARNSPRSLACGRHYGVPVVQSAAELPHADLACVVVRGTLLGGPGSAIAHQLMARGVHVLQEHPVHHEELAESLRTAKTCGVRYRLNTFYPHLPEVRRFLRAAKALLATRKALYIDAACSFQVAYALLDILRILFGGMRPWEFHAAARRSPDAQTRETPLRTLEGRFAGVPISLSIQNQLHPVNPDDFAYLLHRISLGTDAGELTLATTHGPLLWCARPAIPREVLDPVFARPYACDAHLQTDSLSTMLLSPADVASQRKIFREDWPAAARIAIEDLCCSVEGVDDSMERGQQQLGLCRVWQDMVAQLGTPDLLKDVEMPAALTSTELMTLKSAAASALSEPHEREVRNGGEVKLHRTRATLECTP